METVVKEILTGKVESRMTGKQKSREQDDWKRKSQKQNAGREKGGRRMIGNDKVGKSEMDKNNEN